jgi:hypothetical protein
MRCNWTRPISSSTRQQVAADAIGPNTSSWWRSTSMSQIAFCNKNSPAWER